MADDPSNHDSSKDEEYADLLRLELTEVRASDDRADRKSQILLGYTGVTLALSITILGKWLGKPPADTTAIILAYGSILFLSGAALLLALVVRPQLGDPARSTRGTDLSWTVAPAKRF
ncbi:hypothetical protein [Actinoplanes sp. ATCC 53533]|uniref:hypothetical protein n=1 Tax=Actinoplanes sp. ATCC 53533 TaxID=1288362 RepID=UPI000F785182|nr:hypothetical protein [Actinoplanes sp. ATCC 53533]